MRKDFADSVVQYISRYIVEMATFLYNSREQNRLKQEKAKQQIIMDNHSFHTSAYENAAKKQGSIQQKIENLPVDKTNANSQYHYLKMTLIDIPEAQSLLKAIDRIHNSTAKALDANGTSWIEESLQAIENAAIQFKKHYMYM